MLGISSSIQGHEAASNKYERRNELREQRQDNADSQGSRDWAESLVLRNKGDEGVEDADADEDERCHDCGEELLLVR